MEPEQTTHEEDRELLTAKEAAQVFIDAGLSVPTFRRRVNAGQIESIMPEDRKRGALYPKDQVLASIGTRDKKDKAKKKSTPNLKPSTFKQATPGDMPEMAKLLETFYTRIDIKKRAAWIEKNPNVAFISRSSEGEIVACGFMMPLTEEKIRQIQESQVKPPTKPGDIPIYTPGHHYSIYIRAVVVKQAVSKDQRRHWAATFIKGLAKALIELGKKGIYIDRIYSQADTKAGEKALRGLGFTQIKINALTNRKNFMLDIMQSGTSFANMYCHELDTWRAQNEEEA